MHIFNPEEKLRRDNDVPIFERSLIMCTCIPSQNTGIVINFEIYFDTS